MKQIRSIYKSGSISFAEDPKEEISGNQEFRAKEASHEYYYAQRGRDSSYLGLFSTLRLTKRGFSF